MAAACWRKCPLNQLWQHCWLAAATTVYTQGLKTWYSGSNHNLKNNVFWVLHQLSQDSTYAPDSRPTLAGLSSDSRRNLTRLSPDSLRTMPDSHWTLAGLSSDSCQTLTGLSPDSRQTLAGVSPNSRRTLVRFSSDFLRKKFGLSGQVCEAMLPVRVATTACQDLI